ncbi:MAG: ABC-F family ATP-binding cassette domain-containing protein [Bacteroidales bacterium]|nr:ABC-F family ATP-binding cassette domain-containing protein [Bacteroidales bacterium]
MDEVYLIVEKLSKSFGDVELFSDISLSIHKGEKLALIAKNGAGKSTILQILANQLDYNSGSITYKNDLVVAYLEQAPVFDNNLSVEEAILYEFKDVLELLHRYEKLIVNDPNDELHHLMNEIESKRAWDLQVNINQFLSKLKIDNKEQKISELSGGQVKRLALASVLLKQPQFLILDEPTNHLDIEMIEWLEDYLMDSQITLLMVTHDRYFLDRVCNRIIELENNELFSYSGGYQYYLEKREERITQRNTEIDKARMLLKREMEWLNRMPKARTTKAKYRVDSVEEIREKASRKMIKDRVTIKFPSQRLGTKVVDIHHLSKTFDDLQILTDFSYKFAKGEKVGIVGKNGSGKSTFLNLLTQELKPDSGYLEIGSTVSIGYYHQEGIQFSPEKTLLDIVTDIMEVVDYGDGKKLSPVSFLNHFLFPPKMHRVRVDKLSGGEKRRLYLLTVLMRNPNFLILDEPTNDLDIITLNVLEDYLLHFEGCLLVVSHDRYFTDKLVDHLFVFEGEGRVNDFPGNYTDYRWSELRKAKQQKLNDSKEKQESTNAEVQIKNDYSKRLSYKEKVEFEQLEKEIELLSDEKKRLELQLSEQNTDHEKIMELSIKFQTTSDLLDEKEFRWLELSERA